MRVTVVGPGAVGLLWACRLARAGTEVSLMDYRPERAGRLAQSGVELEDPEGSERFNIPVSADPAALAATDLALVCVKAYQTADVARVLGRALAPSGRALTLQNGVGNVEALVAALGKSRVLGGITSEGATLLGEGRVRHAGAGQTHIGPAAGAVDAFTEQVVALMRAAGFAATAAEGVQSLIWTKLVINVGINALTAVLGVKNGRLLELPDARGLMETLVDEALAVGERQGIGFLHDDMQKAVAEVARNTARNVSSMLADVRAQRRTEVDFINGAVAAKAAELGLPAPVNAAMAALVRARQQAYEDSSGGGS